MIFYTIWIKKIKSGFYLDKINIDGKFGILRKDEKE